MIRALLDRAWRTLVTGLGFLFFFAGGLLLSYAVMPVLTAWPGTEAERSRRCRRVVGHAWVLFHDVLRIASVVRFDPRATRLSVPAGPFVLVANHPTLVDVTALAATLPDVVIVAKAALFRSPLVGRLLRYCCHIQSDDGPFAGAAVASAAMDRLAQGIPVLIFPEGTRSPRRGIGKVRPGAFEVAARAGVPVVVTFIRCEPPTLLRGDPWYAIPERAADLTIRQLATLRVVPGEAEAAARSLQEEYAALVRQVPAETGQLPTPFTRKADA